MERKATSTKRRRARRKCNDNTIMTAGGIAKHPRKCHPKRSGGTRFSGSERIREDVILQKGCTRPNRSETRAQETKIIRNDEKHDHQEEEEGEKRCEDHPEAFQDTTV
jgi:hypothetical protein